MKVPLSKITGTEPRREHGDIEGLRNSIADLGLMDLEDLPPRVFNPVRRAGYKTLEQVVADLETLGELAPEKDRTRIGPRTHENLLRYLTAAGVVVKEPDFGWLWRDEKE